MLSKLLHEYSNNDVDVLHAIVLERNYMHPFLLHEMLQYLFKTN